VVSSLVRAPGALCLYVLVASVTPGPNNLMLVNVGLTKGRRAAARTAAGVALGFGIEVFVFGLGVAAAVNAVPGLQNVIEIAGLAYLTWLASILLRSTKLAEAAPTHGFAGAIAYQWVNPKALSMSLTTAGLFVAASGNQQVASAAAVAVIAACVCFPCPLLWGLGGASLTGKLNEQREVVRFNRLAAAALLAMVAWLLVTLVLR
jgi:threonine/homoserine/homoserine lactone efflux protein